MSLLERAFHLAHKIFPNGGSCFEFGVFRGTSYAYQAEQIKKYFPSSSIIGFDSWQGLPEETEGVWIPERHAPGEYAAPKDEVLRKLQLIGITPDEKQFRLIDGFYSDSLVPALRKSFDPLIFVNIDVDIYSSTIELLDFIEPLLQTGVVLYWDDWKDPRDNHQEAWGEHKAWEDWIVTRPKIESITVGTNNANQQVMVITAVNGDIDRMPAERIQEIHNMFQHFENNMPELRRLSIRHSLTTSLKRNVLKIPFIGALAKTIYRAVK